LLLINIFDQPISQKPRFVGRKLHSGAIRGLSNANKKRSSRELHGCQPVRTVPIYIHLRYVVNRLPLIRIACGSRGEPDWDRSLIAVRICAIDRGLGGSYDEWVSEETPEPHP
jgi:hypothetical protein